MDAQMAGFNALAEVLNASERAKFKPVPDGFVVRDDDFVRYAAEPAQLVNLIGMALRSPPTLGPEPGPDNPPEPSEIEKWTAELVRKLAIRLRFEVERDGRAETPKRLGQPFLQNDYGDTFRFTYDGGTHHLVITRDGKDAVIA